MLQTKLYIPTPRSDLVPRLRLLERLNLGLQGPLTLITAPAGFGKTTLISAWIGQSQRLAGWLSLDQADNDPTRFLTYFIAALQAVRSGLGEAILAAWQSPQPPPLETALTLLVNEISSVPDEVIIILDDYHVIEALPIHQALTFLLDHLPPRLHLLLTSRATPPLPLARLRARRQLTELHAADLRFTPDEAATLLNQMIGLGLSVDDIAALAGRTEGWIVGLHLAALSLQGREDRSGFIESFSGSHHFVLDYLVEEVLHRQAPETQSFLLQTAILERMSGPLCDAVTGQGNSQAMLVRLTQANLFIIPLDDERQWYRYHHLFAELLRQQSRQTQPEVIPDLYRRASAWHEQSSLIAEAIEYALKAADLERTARLVEQHGQAFIASSQVATVRRWLAALPEALIHARPRLGLTQAWLRLLTLPIGDIETPLQAVEKALADHDRPEARHLLGEAMVIRAIILVTTDQMAEGIKFARESLALLAEDNLYLRSLAAMALGVAYRVTGELDGAQAILNQGIEAGIRGHNLIWTLAGLYYLADLLVEQGRLRQAWAQLQRGLEWVSRPESGWPWPVVDSAQVGLGRLQYEWNDLETAARNLTAGVELAQQRSNGDIILEGYIALAWVYQAQGQAAQAEAAMAAAAQAAQKTLRLRSVREVAARQARQWLRQGAYHRAERWAEESGLDPSDAVDYSREFEYLTLARVRIAQGADRARQAWLLLTRLHQVAEAGGRRRRVIEILILQALVLAQQGEWEQAILPLTQALTLAEPENFTRIFVDEGSIMAVLLTRLKDQGEKAGPALAEGLKAYLHSLLAAFKGQDGVPPSLTQSAQPLIEPLSERELEVLRLVASGASNQDIADKLFITLGTVKNHLSNILGKLGAGNRRQATLKAEELGLI